MSQQIIAYGQATHSAAQLASQGQEAKRWAKDRSAEVLLWRREGQSAVQRPVEERPRLQQALFCLRAGFAQVLWVARAEDLGGEAAAALVFAVAWAARASVVVEGRLVDSENPTPLQEQARVWVTLADQLDPRQTEPDLRSALEPDIGEYDGEDEIARLARKLVNEFHLTLSQAAQFLNQTNYQTARGGELSSSSLHALLERRPADDVASRADQVLERRRDPALTAPTMLTCGPDAQQLLPAAETYNDTLSRRFAGVFAGSAEGGDPIDLKSLVGLLYGVRAGFVGALFASTANSFGRSPDTRAFFFAECWRHGVVIVIGGSPHDPMADVEKGVAESRSAARSTVRLHAMLRAQDSSSVIYEQVSMTAARITARRLRVGQGRDQGCSLAQIARHLNVEGFVTRKKTGSWHAAAVRELLDS